MLTITYTHEAGTIMEGTAKGDGTAEILKANRWRWGRSIGAWFIPMSRDHRANLTRIRVTAAALEAAGFEVNQEIDDSVRSTAEVEAGKIARQENRVEALNAKAERKADTADALWERHERDVNRLPEGGEPIKIGHHSENRHRNAINKAHDSARRGIDAMHEAERVAERAEAAAHTTASRYSVQTVANRIDKIEADIRRYERQIVADYYDNATGYRPATQAQKDARAVRITPFIEEARDQLTYWKGVRADQIATGKATNFGSDTINKGDAVKIRGHWYIVARTNLKTVSVKTEYSWTERAEYAAIQAVKTAAELEEQKASQKAS